MFRLNISPHVKDHGDVDTTWGQTWRQLEAQHEDIFGENMGSTCLNMGMRRPHGDNMRTLIETTWGPQGCGNHIGDNSWIDNMVDNDGARLYA